LSGELLAQSAGIKLTHVPYKGQPDAMNDLLSGRVTMMPLTAALAVPHIKAGKLRPLAVSSLTRSPLFPGLPTIDEAGVKGFEDITFNGLVAPAGTPREIIVRMREEVAKVVRIPALRDRFIERGVELKASASPDEFTAYIKAEYDKKAKLAKDAGIRLE